MLTSFNVWYIKTLYCMPTHHKYLSQTASSFSEMSGKPVVVGSLGQLAAKQSIMTEQNVIVQRKMLQGQHFGHPKSITVFSRQTALFKATCRSILQTPSKQVRVYRYYQAKALYKRRVTTMIWYRSKQYKSGFFVFCFFF